jgi:hypothetical protein
MILEGENTHGGRRAGSGAKLKYGEKTKTVTFRLPVSKIAEIRSMIKNELENLKP